MVSIVIVNWNTGDKLLACLRSLATLPEKSLINHIFVVDNNSTDDSLERTRALAFEIPIEYMRLPKNIGFAAANNRALRALDNTVDHVLLLNPDTEVTPYALKAMLQVLQEKPEVGIVGPKLLNSDGSLQPSVRSFPTLLTMIWMFLKLPRLLPQTRFWQRYVRSDFNYRRGQAVDQLMGAAFLIRGALLDPEYARGVGLLDELFWIWFEEVDYCKRAKQKGWFVWYTPEAEVMHHGAVSFNQRVGIRRSVPLLNSALYYAYKHFDKLSFLLLCLLWPIGVLLALPASFFHLYLRHRLNAAN
jgi:N-acetylglucosaminyl-diphospho-decaprenol L-rhamnosyltransferase